MPFLKRAAYRLFAVTVFAVCAGSVLTAWLPVLLNTDAAARWMADKSPVGLSWTVRRCGFFGTEVSRADAEPSGSGFLSVDALRLDYSPADLLRGRVSRISIGDLTLRLRLANGRPVLPGIDPAAYSTSSEIPPSPIGIPPPRFDHMEIRNGRILLDRDGEVFRIPFRAEVDADGPEIIWNLFFRPFGADIRADGRLSQTDTALKIQGTLSGEIPAGWLPIPAVLNRPALLRTEFSGRIAPDGAWEALLASVDDPKPDPVRIQSGDVAFHCLPPQLSVTGTGKGPEGRLRIEARIAEAFADTDPVKLTAPDIRMKAEFAASAGDLSGEVHLAASSVAADLKDLHLRLPEAVLSGRLSFPDLQPAAFLGLVTIQNGSLTHDSGKVGVGAITGRLPVSWPWKASDARGEISVRGIEWDRRRAGSIAASFHPTDRGIRAEGFFQCDLLPPLKVEAAADIAFPGPDRPPTASFQARCRPETPLNLGKLAPAAGDLSMDGDIRLSGEWIAHPHTPSCRADLSLEKGVLRSSGKKFAASDIRLNLAIDDGFRLQSAPAQTVSIGSASLGKIRISDARFQFQMEPEGVVFIEKGRFAWCGGAVNLQAVRIQPGVDDYDLTLYCDRLNLAEVLDQFGAARASGEGAVNGRIPIRITRGAFRFDDGFLYSTPGDGGTIQVTAAEMLTEGIPKNSPRFAQIDLTREALKSYDYQWVRLKIFSENENLMLRLQFDGKPTRPLPFVFQQEFGGFVRVDANHPGSHFQGIRLDVNLGLPLDRILRYKGLMEKIQ